MGGDSTLGRKAEATAAGLLRNPFVRGGKRRRQPAEIREVKVSFPGGGLCAALGGSCLKHVDKKQNLHKCNMLLCMKQNAIGNV